jgi:hypothetical protein
LKVLPYMSWFPYDSIRKVVCMAGRWRLSVHNTASISDRTIQHKTAQEVRLRSQQPSQQEVDQVC